MISAWVEKLLGSVLLPLGLIALFTGAITLSVADADEDNLLPVAQRGFERSSLEWESGSRARIWRTRQYSDRGRYSLAVGALNGQWDGTAEVDVSSATGAAGVEVVPGTTYVAGFSVRPWTTFVDSVACELAWYGADGSPIGYSTGPWIPETADSWTPQQCSATAPDGASYVALGVRFHSAYRGDVHFIDDASIKVLSESGVPHPADGADIDNLLLLAQHDMEDLPLGWITQGNASIGQTDRLAFEGQHSLRIAGSDTDPISVDDSRTIRAATLPGTDGVPVTAGRTYEGRLSATSAAEESPARCEVRWYRTNGTIIDTSAGAEVLLDPTRWQALTCQAEAPSEAAYAALRIHVADADRGDEFFVDDAWLVDRDAPAGNDVRAILQVTEDGTVFTPAPETEATTDGTDTAAADEADPTSTTAAGAAAGEEVPGEASTTDSSTTGQATTTTARKTIEVKETTTTTTSATSTTARATTTTTARATTTTAASSPPPSGAPTANSTGPRVSNPQRLGRLEVTGTQSISNVIVDSIVVHAGGQLTATNVRVNGSVAVIPENGAATTKLHLTNSAVHAGLTVNVVDSAGSLYWGGEVPVDIVVSGSWVHHPQGDGSYHTEALAGFGRPRGARFVNSSFIQSGPFNGTATGTTNWHGADTVFDGDHFGWSGGTAAYYTVYVEGRNNVVRNSTFDKGLSDYVYPDSSPMATYSNNVDATSRSAIR